MMEQGTAYRDYKLSAADLMGVAMFQELVGSWNKYNFPNKQGSDQPFKGMTEELGEIAHADLKMEQGIRGDRAEHEHLLQDAIGDFFVYLCDYCNQRGISVAECLAQAWNDIKDRDWRRFPKNGKTE